VIAQAIGVSPQQIRPSRYTDASTEENAESHPIEQK
jgi:lambda repressor-like predicted transcriptional regulator